MPDDFEEQHFVNPISDIKDSFLIAGLGALLFILSILLLCWNEQRTSSAERFEKNDEKQVISVSADSLNPENEGRLVYVSGQAVASHILTDLNGLINVKALRLTRQNNVYQWTEEKTEERRRQSILGLQVDGTNYAYAEHFENHLSDSTTFVHKAGHLNPKISEPFTRDQFADVRVGAYKISKALITQITPDSYLPNNLKVTSTTKKWNGKTLHPKANYMFAGLNEEKPQLGDLEIYMTDVPSGQIYSIIGKQHGQELLPVLIGDDKVVDSIVKGTIASENIFKSQNLNALEWAWGLRFAGWLLMVISLYITFTYIIAAQEYIPALGILSSFSEWEFASGIGTALSATIIGSVWVVLHPQLAWMFFVTASVAVLIMFLLVRSRRAT